MSGGERPCLGRGRLPHAADAAEPQRPLRRRQRWGAGAAWLVAQAAAYSRGAGQAAEARGGKTEHEAAVIGPCRTLRTTITRPPNSAAPATGELRPGSSRIRVLGPARPFR